MPQFLQIIYKHQLKLPKFLLSIMKNLKMNSKTHKLIDKESKRNNKFYKTKCKNLHLFPQKNKLNL